MGKNHQLIRPTGAGKAYSFAGVEVLMKAIRSETGGQWSLMEYAAPAGFTGPAPHYHKVMEEGFYVLEGTGLFTINGEQVKAGTGTFINVPPLTMHTFGNPTDQLLRLLVWMLPGGFEGYFEELQQLIAREKNWPPKDMNVILQLLENYDTFAPEV